MFTKSAFLRGELSYELFQNYQHKDIVIGVHSRLTYLPWVLVIMAACFAGAYLTEDSERYEPSYHVFGVVGAGLALTAIYLILAIFVVSAFAGFFPFTRFLYLCRQAKVFIPDIVRMSRQAQLKAVSETLAETQAEMQDILSTEDYDDEDSAHYEALQRKFRKAHRTFVLLRLAKPDVKAYEREGKEYLNHTLAM